MGRTIEKWLDTGCGTGTLCAIAKRVFPTTEFTLADPSVQMLNIAKERLKTEGKIVFVQAASEQLNLCMDCFDVITAIQCIII